MLLEAPESIAPVGAEPSVSNDLAVSVEKDAGMASTLQSEAADFITRQILEKDAEFFDG